MRLPLLKRLHDENVPEATPVIAKSSLPWPRRFARESSDESDAHGPDIGSTVIRITVSTHDTNEAAVVCDPIAETSLSQVGGRLKCRFSQDELNIWQNLPRDPQEPPTGVKSVLDLSAVSLGFPRLV